MFQVGRIKLVDSMLVPTMKKLPANQCLNLSGLFDIAYVIEEHLWFGYFLEFHRHTLL